MSGNPDSALQTNNGQSPKNSSRSAVAERACDALCLCVASKAQCRECSLLTLAIEASDLPLHTIKFCSVVFGIMLSLSVINTSSSSHVKNKRHCLPAKSVGNLPQCITLSGRTTDNMRGSQIVVENHDFCLPHLYLMPSLKRTRHNTAMTFGMEKLEWCG